MALGTPFIGDSASLPCSKTDLKRAFDVYLMWMREERDKDPAGFAREGYGETLQAAESCYCMIDDFHDVAPEDKDAVERINSCMKKQQPIADSDFDIIAKYPIGGGA
jgi:hypothetical protein